MASFASIRQAIYDRETRKQQYQAHIQGLNAYDRHKKFISDYDVFYGRDRSAQEVLPIKTDKDTLREGYRFIRSEEDDMNPSWEQRYCIADMTHYKSGKIGLRWRTEKEVISGKGQFVCGNKHCNQKDGLASYEVNFSYVEAGENKQALVKLVCCERCAGKLLYKKHKEKEQMKEDQRRKRERSKNDDQDDEEHERRRERKKGPKTSSSDKDNNKTDKNDENFEEYLEGMFP